MKNHRQSLLLTLAALLIGVQQALAVRPSILNRANSQKMEQWVETTYSKMSPQERISQIMIMAISPNRVDESKMLVEKYVKTYKVGGLIFESSDIATQAEITNCAQAMSSIPLMIALDAEWGLTMRLKDAPEFPHNLLLGGVNDDQLLYEYGKELARECRLMGVHVNFAPVLDVLDREGTVVGSRSFGFSPEVVARHGVAFAKGLEDGGVLSTAKHFPGHGSTTADSHKELPLLDKSFKEMRMYDLVPFDSYVKAGLGGMLTAHIDVTFFDDGTTPCSMSKDCVEGLLKQDLGFEGLVFTDALDMEGAKSIPGDPCVNAILAGNDVLLMPRDIEASINAVMAAIEDGTISWGDIESRSKKMLRYKYALGIIDSAKTPIDVNKVASQINTQYSQDLNRRLIAAAVTVAVNKGNILPIKNVENGKIQVLTLGVGNMFQKRCSSYANIKCCNASSAVSANYSELIIAISNEAYISEALAAAKKCRNVTVVVLDSPEKMLHYADLVTDSNIDAVVMGYGNNEVWQDYAAQTVFGGSPANGVLPVTIKSRNNNKVLHAGDGVKYTATRLGYTLPVEVGFNDKLLSRIDSICNYGISQKAFPGCQVLVVRHGKVVVDSSYGEINFDSGIPVTDNTLFGLASVSKASGTLSGIMKLYDEGKIKLDEPASKYIGGLRDTDKSDLTFRQLLYHETGMQPSLSMWEMMFDPNTYSGKLIISTPNDVNTIKVMKDAYGNKDAKLRTDILASEPSREFNIAIAEGIYGGKVTYDSIMARIYHSKLRPNKNYCYSCLNFCLLADALQNITHTDMDAYLDKNIFGKLGAYHTTYRPLNKFAPDDIAYTEVDTYLRKQHIHGYVHDELAAFSGGVQGNAGLFSNANDLAKLFQMWLNGGEYGGVTFYKRSTVDTFLKSKSPRSHRGLGFDKPNLKNKDASSTCDEATSETVGHTGFTGTCYWIDPKNDMIYIFLSNRVCPTRDNPAFSRVSARSHIHSLLYQSIVE
ncbi:MAG: serine hydrolase [Muribaculaceae bacterium]|nr:serine hydrolase [Muribaculaceae bacterium]